MRCMEKDLLELRDKIDWLIFNRRISFETCSTSEKKDLAKNYLNAKQYPFNDVRTIILGEDEVLDNFEQKYNVSLRNDEYYEYSDELIDSMFIDFIFDNKLPVNRILKDSFIEHLECYFGEMFEKAIYTKIDKDKADEDYDLYRDFGRYSVGGLT